MSLPPFFLHFSNYMKYDTNCQELFLLGVIKKDSEESFTYLRGRIDNATSLS